MIILFKAALLEFDNEFKLIADPSWNGVDVNAAMFMEEHLKETNAILLSHSTAEFISGFILLCIKFPILMSSIPVYSTLPVNQLGEFLQWNIIVLWDFWVLWTRLYLS